MHPVVTRASTVSVLRGFVFLLLGWVATSSRHADKSTTVGPKQLIVGHFDSDAAHRKFYRQQDIATATIEQSEERTSNRLRSRSRRLETKSDNSLVRLFYALIEYLMSLLTSTFSQSSTACPGINDVPPLPGKKGIGLTMRADGLAGSATENLPKVKALSVSWNYSWGTNRPAGQPDGVEFVPMIWGGYENTIEDTISKVRADFEAGQTHRLLGYNEPDFVKQSNVPVERAVRLWKSLEESGMPLVSPSAAHPSAAWMQEFMAEAESSCLRMEWLGVHWYGGANAKGFKAKMLEIFEMYGSRRPLLITEFASADWTTGGDPSRNRYTEQMVLDFTKEVLPWLEQQDFIAGYAWFPFEKTSPVGHTSALFESDGQLTTLGKYYASVTPENIYGDQSIVVEA